MGKNLEEHAPRLLTWKQKETEKELVTAFTVHDFEEIAEKALTLMRDNTNERFHLYLVDLYKAANALALTLENDGRRSYSSELQGSYYDTPLREQQ